MAKRRGPKIVTKKHLAREEREQRQRRIIMISSIVILVIVVILIGYGIIEQVVIEPNQPVAVVGEDKITTVDFENRVKFERRQLVQQYLSTYQNMQLFGDDENSQVFFQQTLNQIQFQLEPETLGQEILDFMVDDTLIRQESASLGILITDEEVDKYLEEALGYYKEGQPPTQTPTLTTPPTSTLSPTQLAIVQSTSTPTVTPVLTATSVTPNITATPPEIIGSDNTDPDSSPTAFPSATPFTYEAYQELYKEVITSFKDDINLGEKEFRAILVNELYRQKVRDIILADFICELDQVWARHILVEDEATAQEVLEKIEAGDDFAALAAQYSTDDSNKDSGGDLGWFGTNRMVMEFEKVAFNLSVGEISEPVETQFGWHIIQSLGHEVRSLPAYECDQLKENEFTTWLEQQRIITTIEIYEHWRERVPTEPSIPPNISQF